MNVHVVERLIARSDMQPDGCWLWLGEKSQKGYGRITINGQRRRVHHVAWEELRGERPDGLVPDHTCRSRNCWNPAHIDWVTNRENILRGEGPTAINARKTHCNRGHEFTPENTYSGPYGRKCKTCQALNVRKAVA